MVAQENEESDEDKLAPEGDSDGTPEEISDSDIEEDVPVSSVKLQESNMTEAESQEDSQE